jgi:hypothetical protein
MITEITELKEIVTSGCDERIFLRPDTNANKYHLNPIVYENLFQRGSCTCGTFTPFGFEVGVEFLKKYDENLYDQIVQDQTRRLHDLLSDSEINFDVYYGPSGSDMMYLPLLFQAMLKPDKSIVNIVSCPEELGSGSKLAAELSFYSEWNQFGEKIPMGQKLTSNIQSEVHYLAARENSGHIANRNKSIRTIIEQNPNKPMVGNLVFGSKSGIKDDLHIIDEFPEIMWVVDMCQFRTDRNLIHELINKGVMIMVTGSKFYQAPPFCGALLVPTLWTEKLKKISGTSAAFFKHIFSAYDFPESLVNIRENLPEYKNIGLRLRWEVALREMEAYLSFPQEESNALIRRWNQVVTGRLAQSDTFRLMPNMELTNDSIVSFMVLVNGRALNNVDLKKLFDFLVLNEHEGLDGFNRVFLGQPVQYGDKSFIRLAIGSYSVRRQLLNQRFEPFNDIRMIEIIEESVAKLFE